MTATLTFADLKPEHLEAACALSRQCGWPHRAEDWALALRLSRGVAALQDDRVVGTALATPFGAVATANMIIVDGAMRGRGLGRTLMDEAMARVAPSEWRLVATDEGRPLYGKLGFEARGRIVQHQGQVAAVAAPAGVAFAQGPDRAALLALDRAATGCDRTTPSGATPARSSPPTSPPDPRRRRRHPRHRRHQGRPRRQAAPGAGGSRAGVLRPGGATKPAGLPRL
jgi:predicted N-acetyltransferase YhbS